MSSLYCGPPKFFKIIQNHELQNHELRVPKKFVEKHWKSIPNPAVITFPNGIQQKLFWVKLEGDIWFQKNWEKIAKFLKFGYVVVFKYMGGSCFQLEIFGLNSLEIDYSIFIDQVKREAEFEEVSDDTVTDKWYLIPVTDTTEQKFSRTKFVDETNAACTSQRRKRGTKRGVTNPSFELLLTKTSAHGYLFRIPCEFSRTYMEDYEGIAFIRVGEDRTWKIKVKYDSVRDFSVVNSGWQPFSKKYNLQTGDVCKFVMTRSEPLSFTITITRAREE
ncbi:hypothetical protein TSUD_12650 [Trifolium subterraneum]|uniref:TF-B3 domain-containing protein n=1 Tax=Trifolium subterraneum TaxID=3900 RepID=A0A2Z6P5A0_TRISU|nr:hypothetical protein TSUD_12650 [Trifolium subterraneum]